MMRLRAALVTPGSDHGIDVVVFGTADQKRRAKPITGSAQASQAAEQSHVQRQQYAWIDDRRILLGRRMIVVVGGEQSDTVVGLNTYTHYRSPFIGTVVFVVKPAPVLCTGQKLYQKS
jgi:hypothetical protein